MCVAFFWVFISKVIRTVCVLDSQSSWPCIVWCTLTVSDLDSLSLFSLACLFSLALCQLSRLHCVEPCLSGVAVHQEVARSLSLSVCPFSLISSHSVLVAIYHALIGCPMQRSCGVTVNGTIKMVNVYYLLSGLLVCCCSLSPSVSVSLHPFPLSVSLSHTLPVFTHANCASHTSHDPSCQPALFVTTPLPSFPAPPKCIEYKKSSLQLLSLKG